MGRSAKGAPQWGDSRVSTPARVAAFSTSDLVSAKLYRPDFSLKALAVPMSNLLGHFLLTPLLLLIHKWGNFPLLLSL